MSEHSEPATVLVVEDEQSVRELVRSILQAHGYSVLDASRGAEALRVCEQHPGPIHMLLTDVHMPEMNGPALAQRVRALRPRIRVLYMSADPGMDLLADLGLQPDTSFIWKPFSPDALVRMVRAFLTPT